MVNGAVMTSPLTGASLVTAGSISSAGESPSRARANATAYAQAMREAGAPETPAAAAKAPRETPPRTDFTREAPFGSERPRLLRPGSLVDIRV